MNSRDIVKQILTTSAHAPSGGNSQPWKFEVTANSIQIYADPEKDHPILNFRNRGTWVAHGALLENISIAVEEYGHECDIEIFPDASSRSNLTAIVTLRNGSGPHSKKNLYHSIPKRNTNRKAYRNEPLSEAHRDTLEQAGMNFGDVVCGLTKDDMDLNSLGRALAVADRIMLENRILHGLFFKEIVWTEEEERTKREGLYLKTMELEPSQEFMFKRLRHWPLMSILTHLGVAKKIASENARIYSSASAIGAVLTPDRDDAFINAGRLLQRVWLTATDLGLSVQVFGGVTFLAQSARADELSMLSRRHIKLIGDAYSKLNSVFGTKDKLISLLFRVGYSDKPTAYSSKKKPRITYIKP
jgi:hypothetical protein